MTESKNSSSKFFENLSLILLGILFIFFPIVFSSLTTDTFGLPKQILLGIIALSTLIFLGIRMITEGEIKLRNTPFDIPILIFGLVVLVSAIFSIDRSDALTSFVPLLFAILMYFVIVNTAKSEGNVLFLLATSVLGGCIVSVLQVLTYFNIYVLPMQYTHVRVFTPLGSLLDQALYLGLLLPMVGYLAYATAQPILNKARNSSSSNSVARFAGFIIATIILLFGFVITIYELITVQQPLILPFDTGFQTGFAAISQDTGRIAQSFLLGSGYGTFLIDFSRFKAAAYNNNPNLWAFTFFRSSSFILELLATTGVLGLLSYLFLSFKIIKDKPNRKEGGFGVFLSVIVALILSLILPFSFIITTLLFILLGLFASIQGLAHPERVYDLSLKLRGVMTGGKVFQSSQERSFDRALPVIFLIPIIIIVAGVGYFSYQYSLSDITFQKSLVAAQQNNGLLTYNLQNNAINMFPYRDAYYRIFSQTNLSLANSLALQQPRGKKVPTQTQQTIYTLVQQSINAGRSAVALSPANTLDWQNLSSVYRALIGFGTNAENFSIAANQQAIALDSNNPQEYINLGGIYYQLSQWDQAINEFSIAVNLKPDYANAHYNLGHALEQKGDLPDALAQYKIVAQLVANNPTNVKTINSDIAALQAKQVAATKTPTIQSKTPNQPALGINNSQAQLPARNPKATIPGPGVSPQPTKEIPTPTGATQTSPTTTVSPTPGS